AGANLLTAASVGTEAQARFLPFVVVSLLLVLWYTWSERWTRAGTEPSTYLPFRWAAVSLLGGLCVLGLALPLGWTLAPSMRNGDLRQWATERWTRLQPSFVNPLHLSTSLDVQTLSTSGFGNQ